MSYNSTVDDYTVAFEEINSSAELAAITAGSAVIATAIGQSALAIAGAGLTLTGIGTAIGFLGGPIGAMIGAGLGALVAKKLQEKKKLKIEAELKEVYKKAYEKSVHDFTQMINEAERENEKYTSEISRLKQELRRAKELIMQMRAYILSMENKDKVTGEEAIKVQWAKGTADGMASALGF